MRTSRGASPAVRAVVAVAATSLFMVLVAWATLVGPDEVFTGPGTFDRTPVTPRETCVPPDATENPDKLPLCRNDVVPRGDSGPTTQGDSPLWVDALAWVLLVVAVLLVLAVVALVVLLVREVVSTRRVREDRQAVAFETLAGPDRLVEAIHRDATEQDTLLRDGDPRNAIVAAWQRFEVQGESAGMPRKSWETSSEYALRILDLVSADSGAVNRLAGLYREARFSDHPLTEEHRAEALQALAAIRHSLGARA